MFCRFLLCVFFNIIFLVCFLLINEHKILLMALRLFYSYYSTLFTNTLLMYDLTSWMNLIIDSIVIIHGCFNSLLFTQQSTYTHTNTQFVNINSWINLTQTFMPCVLYLCFAPFTLGGFTFFFLSFFSCV